MDNRIPEIRKQQEKKLTLTRYEHSLSVSYTCISLAMKHGGALEQAELAGLLHDCAKCYDDDAILKHCRKHQVPVTEAERRAPAVLHAKYGAWMVRNQYHIEDEEIISAIACHTTGKPDMSLLDKILYVADYMEPRRNKLKNLTEIRRLAYENLDEAMYQIMESTLEYLKMKDVFIDPMSLEAFDYYQTKRNARKEL